MDFLVLEDILVVVYERKRSRLEQNFAEVTSSGEHSS